MGRVIGFLAAVAVALLPLAIWPDWRIAMAGAVAGLVCAAGMLLASFGAALAGTILALLVFAAAIVLDTGGGAGGPAFGMGAAMLVVLDSAYFQSCFRGERLDPGLCPAHLAGLALTLLVAVLAAVTAILSAPLLVSAHPLMRSVLATIGGLLTMAAAVWAIAAKAGSPQPRNWM